MKPIHILTRFTLASLALALITMVSTFSISAQGPLRPTELLALKSAGNQQISPDGTEILYSVSTPRGPN